MLTKLRNLLNKAESSLWLIPSVMSIAALLLAMLSQHFDEYLATHTDYFWPHWLLYAGDLEGSRLLLSTVAGSMITVAGVTFSTTMVALSLASSQFGPRLLTNFMRDKGNQVVLGAFIASFLYCLLALGNGDPTVVPTASATIGVVLAVFNVTLLIYFIHHASSTIRAEHVVEVVAYDLMNILDNLVAEPLCSEKTQEDNEYQKVHARLRQQFSEQKNVLTVNSQKSGYIQAINSDGLLALATKEDVLIKLRHRAGQFIREGEPIADLLILNECAQSTLEQIPPYFLIGSSRTGEEDPEYSIHQLVEVAVRALSPGINDPFTAIACVDWLSSGLCRVAPYDFLKAHGEDCNGQTRLMCDPVDFNGLLNSAFDQIRQASYNHPAVAIHLLEALAAIAHFVKNSDRYDVLLKQARTLMDGVEASNMQGSDKDDLTLRYQTLLSKIDSAHTPSAQ